MACFATKQYCVILKSSMRRLPYFRNIRFLCSNYKSIKKFYPPAYTFLKPQIIKSCRNFVTSLNHHSKYDSNEQVKQVLEIGFKDMILYRQAQAQSTVLIELLSKEDALCAAKLCKDCGTVKVFLLYSDGCGGTFLLTEFAQKRAVHQFLQGCYFRNAFDGFPVYSRFVKFEKRRMLKKLPASIQNEIIDITNNNCRKSESACSVSEAMQRLYETERLSDLSSRLRFLLAVSVQEAMCGMFPFCEVLPFGSSVNSFGVNGSDLDVMLQLYPDTVIQKKDFYFQIKTCDNRIVQQRIVNTISDLARNLLPGIYVNNRILHARMPIVKMRHKILDLECDISVNNMTAVHMSEILYFCGGIDSRIRPLIYTVKRWAKEAFITYSTPGSWITNFSLTLLLLFFLQNRKSPILPPLMKAVAMPGCTENYSCTGVQYLNNPAKWRSLASNNKEDLSSLLKEFFAFVASFPFEQQHISLLTGKATPKEDFHPIWIQYPMEEDKNVAKNVSKSELTQLCNAARLSASFLENCSEETLTTSAELTSLLGCTKIKREEDIDVNSFVNSENNNAQKKKAGAV